MGHYECMNMHEPIMTSQMWAPSTNLLKIPHLDGVLDMPVVHDEIRDRLGALAAQQVAQRHQSADRSIPLCYLLQGRGSEMNTINGFELLEQMLLVRVNKFVIHSWRLATCRTMPRQLRPSGPWTRAGKKEHLFAVPAVQCSRFMNELLFCAAKS